MVDVATKFISHKDQAAARMGRVRVGGYKRPGIRVEPKNEDLRRVMFHPVGKIKFRSTGSVEWPDDQFTRRRIRDGDVIVVESNGQSEQRKPQHQQARRHPQHSQHKPPQEIGE